MESPAKKLAPPLSYATFWDVLAVFALIFAMLKDMADITIGIIPVIGQMMGSMISVLAFIFIFLIMLFVGGIEATQVLKSFMILISGSAIDIFPLINLLPATTAATLTIFIMILKERRKKAEQGATKAYV